MNPKSALMQAATSAAPKLNLYEATARSSSTVARKSDHVIDVVFRTSAASGSSTSALRKNVVKPSVRPKPGRMLGCRNQDDATAPGLHRQFEPRRVHDQHRSRRITFEHGREPVPADRVG